MYNSCSIAISNLNIMQFITKTLKTLLNIWTRFGDI